MNELEKLEKAKQDIQDKIDKLKSEPKLETGKWYKNESQLFCLTKLHGGQTYGYGFQNEEWKVFEDTSIGGWTFDNERTNKPATNEEVEAALIKEAKKRGFKSGALIKSKYDVWLKEGGVRFEYKNKTLIMHSERSSTPNDGYVSKNGGHLTIFSNGKWAEIIQEPKVVINGYEMKQEGGMVKFGCAEFNEEFFIEIKKGIYDSNCNYSNRKIKSITLDSGVEITVKQLEEIVKNIK